MIMSMTGYGTHVAEYNNKKIHVEIKALNSKNIDINGRIASLYREKELDIRQIIANRLERGKVDFAIWIEEEQTKNSSKINEEAVKEYYKQINDLANNLGLDTSNINATDWMTIILRMPDTLNSDEIQVIDDQEWNVVIKTLQVALDNLCQFRQQEGNALQKKFNEKIDNIERLLNDIQKFESIRVEKIRQRITEALEKYAGPEYDKNRLEQEMIYYIEKLDISEEKQRLKNHLDYFRDTMNAGHGQGKKLGFIAQEMGREINTTGSKSNLAEMQNIVVMMKDELEQIKEQVLNVM